MLNIGIRLVKLLTHRFGTHPSGPSEILVDGEFQLLKAFLEVHFNILLYEQTHPEMLGNSQGLKSLELPFLSKVLSVDTALSIQAHPDKKLAEILHEKKPDLYKDDNHKPEMAYALGDFVAMCGFRAVDEIVAHLNNYVHFRNLIGESSRRLNHFISLQSNQIKSYICSQFSV